MIQKISTEFNRNYKKQLNNTSFKALRLAEYSYGETIEKEMILYKLEKSDINFLQHILNNIEKFFAKYKIENESARQVIQEAFSAGIEILKEKKHPETKADVLMAFYDNEPSTIIIGNVLKTDKKGKLHYSSRKEHTRRETELDWLATWNKKIPKEGQATVYEYFHRLLNHGFKSCFVRSELPQKSPAVAFYKNMGFKLLSNKARPILRKNDNDYLIGSYDDMSDKIIPMKITFADIVKTLKNKADILMRKEIDSNRSYQLPKEEF